MTDTRRLVIGTRGSALALWQAHAVQRALAEARPDLACEIRVIKTVGDRNLATPLAQIGDKGLFTKELEAELVSGTVDVCVHSMKDVPNELADGCAIVGMLPRADVRDALVCGPRIAGATCLADVADGARIGTGSLRRVAQLAAAHPGLVPTPIRGNVDTRVRKALGDDYEGAILAVAGLARLGMADRIAFAIDPAEMIPAVGQGAVGVEARVADEGVRQAVAAINDEATFACVMAERTILRELDGSCTVPMGAYARALPDGGLRMDAFVASVDGARQARASRVAAPGASVGDLARDVLAALLDSGAREIRDEIKEAAHV